MKIDGRCHCGYVTFEAEADPETTTTANGLRNSFFAAKDGVDFQARLLEGSRRLLN